MKRTFLMIIFSLIFINCSKNSDGSYNYNGVTVPECITQEYRVKATNEAITKAESEGYRVVRSIVDDTTIHLQVENMLGITSWIETVYCKF